MSMHLLSTRRTILLSALSVPWLVACGGSDDDSFDDRADIADPKVRFVHVVPGGPAVTLRRNDVAESNVSRVPYLGATQYYDVNTQTYSFTLVNADSGALLATVVLPVTRGNKYTLVAVPKAAGVELLAIRDPYNKSLTSKDTRVRLLNAAANVPSFDAYFTAPGADLTPLTPTMPAVAYAQAVPASEKDSVEIGPASYQLRLTAPGSKVAFFGTALQAPENGDWLLVAVPDPLDATRVRLLRVRADDSANAADEILPS